MALEVGDAVLKVSGETKDLDKALDQIQSKTERAMKKMQGSMRAAGVAFTAVGAAGLAMVSSAKKMNAQLGQTALTIGATAKEMRDLALSTTNVTFPLESVTATFELLARAGVKDQEILKDTALAFDTLGDAIGIPADLVTKNLIPTMKTFNVTATDMAKKTDALTYLFKKTTVSLEDFNRMVGYVTPEIVEMGLTTEDMIAILAELEAQGYSGEVMTRAFRSAVTLATKEQIPLNEALGISTKTIEEYKVELEGATGLTQDYADIANTQFGIMDKLKQAWSELTFKMGTMLAPLEGVLAAMTALGPILIVLSTSIGQAVVVTVAHTAAVIAHTASEVTSIAIAKAYQIALATSRTVIRAVITVLHWLTGAEVLNTIAVRASIINVVAHTAALVAHKIATIAATVATAAFGIALTVTLGPIGLIIVAIGAMVAALGGLVFWLSRSKTAMEELPRYTEESLNQVRDQATEILSRMRDLAQSTADIERESLNQRLEDARNVHEQRMDMFDEEYKAQIKAIDAEAAAEIEALEARIGEIDDLTTAEGRALRDRRAAERTAELKDRIAAEKDAKRREALVKQLNDHIANIERQRLLKARLDEKKQLRDSISAVREAAQERKDTLLEEIEAKRQAENEKLEATEKRIELETAASQKRLELLLKHYEEDLAAVQEAEGDKLLAIHRRLRRTYGAIQQFNEDLAELPPVIMPIRYVVEAPGFIERFAQALSRQLAELTPGLQRGGIAMRPMIAKIGEQAPRIPEAVIPLDRLGGGFGKQVVNIIVELDGMVLAQALGEPLVDEIRLRTGVNV